MSGQLANVREGEANQAVMATRHLLPDRRRHRFSRTEPRKIEGLLGRLAVTIYGNNKRKADRVLARVVEATSVGIREIFDNGERRGINRDPRQRNRAEIFFAVAQKRIAHPLAKQHTTADHHPRYRPIGCYAQQHAHFGDVPRAVNPHWNSVHIHNREPATGQFHVLVGQPRGIGGRVIGDVDFTHGAIVPD